MSRLTILLSTFNGEAYIREQLDSFLSQSFSAWRLLWRDDGSSDGTVAIMHEFANKVGHDRCWQADDSGLHYGAATSFLSLLARVGNEPLVAFADQDDVWLPDKLQNAVRQMGQADSGQAGSQPGSQPTLYCARQFWVDENLRGHRVSRLHQDRGFPHCLTQNIANGNTLVLNNAAARLVSATPAPEATVHDWWSYIVVSACGGQVIFDSEPQVLYRLHKNNMIGRMQPFHRRAWDSFRRGPYIFMTTMRRHAAALSSARLAPMARSDLVMLQSALHGTAQRRVGALRCPRFRRGSRIENILFRYWFMTG